MAQPEKQPTKRRMFMFTSLTFKVGFLAIFVIIFVMTVFSAVFLITGQQQARAGILRDGKTFANYSAASLYNYYTQFYTHPDSADFEKFKTATQKVMQDSVDIHSVSLLAPNGRILFDSSELTAGRYSGAPRTIENQAVLNALASDETTVLDTSVNNDTAAEIIVPLHEASGGHIFSMRYIFGYDSLSQQMHEMYQRVAIVVLILLALVGIATVLFARRLVSPIIRLTLVAEQIKNGNLSARAPITSHDEMGRLSSAINEMATQLQAYYISLEEKVQQRTADLEKAQGKLQQNVKQDEALLASIADGVIATDRSGNIIWLNDFAANMLHISDYVIGKPFDSVVATEDDKENAVAPQNKPTARALASGAPYRTSSYYFAHRDENGKPIARFAVAVTVAPVVIGTQTVGLITVFRDITKERQVDRMKTEFISLASHQLRTPLSAIKWFTEMLLSGDAGKLNDDQLEFAKNVADSTERMIALVNALLNISRIESGRILVDPQPTDLKQLVAGIVNDLKAKTEDRRQTLIISVHDDLPRINLDPRLISQVYLNLLSNAIKYTPKGGEIQVFISRKDDDIISQVTDNGYGIPKDQQNQIFQKFFRASNAVKIETDGTGLGLYLIKAIVESSGGKIWFKSEEGKGTSFWFSIPVTGMKPKEGEVTLDT